MPQFHLEGPPRGLDPFQLAYVTAMFFTATDDSPRDREIRKGATTANLTAKSLAAIKRDCDAFRAKAGALLDGASERQAGHDFWLTREGHGAGFWDRSPDTYPNDPKGEALTALAKQFGEVTGAGYLCQVGRWIHYD